MSCCFGYQDYEQEQFFLFLFNLKLVIIIAVRNRRQRGSTSKASDMPIKMRYGRKDCNGKPREKSASFPDPRMGITGTLKWCKDVFNFTRRECVAIMGKSFLSHQYPISQQPAALI